METHGQAPKLFLLSPASATGVRALQLAAPGASFAAASRLRSPSGLPIGEAFCFMSALYFRGKIAYASRFAAAWPSPTAPAPARPEPPAPQEPPACIGFPILIIAPGFGLVPPDWPLTRTRLRKLARTPVDPARRAYSGPLRRDARALAAVLPAAAQVVLLGSIATGKYLDLLIPIFGERLLCPRAFAGTGDMSRGALMLRAAASGAELEYTRPHPLAAACAASVPRRPSSRALLVRSLS